MLCTSMRCTCVELFGFGQGAGPRLPLEARLIAEQRTKIEADSG
jgi:hypothetical protein